MHRHLPTNSPGSISPASRLDLLPVSTKRFPGPGKRSSRLSKRSGPISLPWCHGNALEADAEDLGWAFVNIFHRSATRKSALDRATDEVRALIATADGSEVHTHELETQVERAQCAEGAMLALEEMREVAAASTSTSSVPHGSPSPVRASITAQC
jgi:hypothetical protein